VGLSNQGSLMDALERLRPYMLSSRGTTPSVSIDGAPAVELSLLRTIPVRVVRQVRLQRAASGTGRARITHNGDTVVGDVIVVTTWEADRPR